MNRNEANFPLHLWHNFARRPATTLGLTIALGATALGFTAIGKGREGRYPEEMTPLELTEGNPAAQVRYLITEISHSDFDNDATYIVNIGELSQNAGISKQFHVYRGWTREQPYVGVLPVFPYNYVEVIVFPQMVIEEENTFNYSVQALLPPSTPDDPLEIQEYVSHAELSSLFVKGDFGTGNSIRLQWWPNYPFATEPGIIESPEGDDRTIFVYSPTML